MPAARWPGYPSCYFNQAGSGPARPAARARATQIDDQLAALGAHSAAGLDLVDSTLDACRATLQRALGVPTAWTVSFAQSATDALNLLAEGVRPLRGRLAASDQEHPSGILSLVVQRRRGFHVRLVPSEPRTSWSERIAEARAEADLVLVSSVSYRSGWRFPVEELSPPTDQGGLLVVDISQALGQIDLAPIWGVVDAAVGLGHKWLHGPLPSGFVLTSPRARDRLDVPRGGWHARDSSSGLAANWRQDGRLYEPGSPDAGRVAGLQVALESLSELQSQAAGQHVGRLRSQVLASLESVGWAPLPGSVPGMIFVPVPRNETARRAAAHFARLGVTVKDLNAPEVPDCLRISLCAFHQPSEVDRLCEAIRSTMHRDTATVAPTVGALTNG